MSDCMTFPDDWREFLRDCSFKDTKEIYTNGSELIPVFRVEQLIEHLEGKQKTTFEKDGHHIRCTSCGEYWCDTDREGDAFPKNFCPACGRRVKLE